MAKRGPLRGERGHRWGTFQGWATVALGALVSIHGMVVESALSPRWVAAIVTGLLMIYLGTGLLEKRRYAVVLFYGVTVFVLIGMITRLVSRIDECVFVTAWYVLPAIFYYPKRWKEYAGNAAPPKPTDTPTKSNLQALLPDLGTHLAGMVGSQKTKMIYPSWELATLAVVGSGHYCTTHVQTHEGIAYCATFDFEDGVLEQILARTSPQIRDYIIEALIEDPYSIRHIPIPIPISVGVAVVLGDLQQGPNDLFIPLVITEVFR